VICARGGSDRVKARGGSDLVRAGRGHDLVYGGRRGDTLRGAGGRDTLVGQVGADTLSGGARADVLDAVDGRGTDRRAAAGAATFATWTQAMPVRDARRWLSLNATSPSSTSLWMARLEVPRASLLWTSSSN
jgi:hypothetical protein